MLTRRCVSVALWLGVSFGSYCRCWLRVLLMCSQLVPLSCLAAGDSALWGGGLHLEEASTVQLGWWGRVALHACGGVPQGVVRVEVDMGGHWRTTHGCVHEPVNMGGRGGGRIGGASCRLMRRAVRLARVATWGKASEHRARAVWVNMLLCARWETTDLYLSLRTFLLSVRYRWE